MSKMSLTRLNSVSCEMSRGDGEKEAHRNIGILSVVYICYYYYYYVTDSAATVSTPVVLAQARPNKI